MAFWSRFPRYVSKAEKMARAGKKLNQLKKKKQDLQPVLIEGSAIARTWWGKAWNRNLERYADYSNRIGRGRSYVRCGAVLDLRIEAGEIKALVHGSRAKPYSITIKLNKLNRNIWQQIASECSGKLESLEELLAGKFPKALEETFMQTDRGLFPAPKELEFDCSCPDWASMCKHVAATLYGVGARLDQDPSLFFTLRGVAMDDLVARTVSSKAEDLLKKASKKSSRIIQDSDLAAVFGIELAGDPENESAAAAKRIAAARPGKTVKERTTANPSKKSATKKKAVQKAKRKAKAAKQPRVGKWKQQ